MSEINIFDALKEHNKEQIIEFAKQNTNKLLLKQLIYIAANRLLDEKLAEEIEKILHRIYPTASVNEYHFNKLNRRCNKYIINSIIEDDAENFIEHAVNKCNNEIKNLEYIINLTMKYKSINIFKYLILNYKKEILDMFIYSTGMTLFVCIGALPEIVHITERFLSENNITPCDNDIFKKSMLAYSILSFDTDVYEYIESMGLMTITSKKSKMYLKLKNFKELYNKYYSDTY